MRGYYGSVSHDVKAIYQRYLGWFDGNPARLWPHPPEALGPRYVDAIGGVDRVVELAQQAFDDGDFRWAATLLDHAVFTDTTHVGASELYQRTLEQLAYQTENATWRNFFLTGALELRDGNVGTPITSSSSSIASQLTPEMFLDALAIAVNGPASWDIDVVVDMAFTDRDEVYQLTLRHGVLTHRRLGDGAPEGQVRVSVPLPKLVTAVMGGEDSTGSRSMDLRMHCSCSSGHSASQIGPSTSSCRRRCGSADVPLGECDGDTCHAHRAAQYQSLS